MQIGGIILAGGRSRRMRLEKATLPFGSEALLQRMVRIVNEVAAPIVVVAAREQKLPALQSKVIVARDRVADRGPMEALAAGLQEFVNLQTSKYDAGVSTVYITACDTPLLKPEFIQRVCGLLDTDHDAAVPVVDEWPQPLAGCYRTSIALDVEEMLLKNQLSLQALLKKIRTRRIATEELVDIDPELESLRNLNTPADYHAALAAAGLADENRIS